MIKFRGHMPIFDFVCQSCARQFEALVRSGYATTCPSCGSVELERLLSLPAVQSEGTRAQALRAARRRDTAQATERTHEQLKYERSHND